MDVKHFRHIHMSRKGTTGLVQLYRKGGKFRIFILLWGKAANISGCEKIDSIHIDFFQKFLGVKMDALLVYNRHGNNFKILGVKKLILLLPNTFYVIQSRPSQKFSL